MDSHRLQTHKGGASRVFRLFFLNLKSNFLAQCSICDTKSSYGLSDSTRISFEWEKIPSPKLCSLFGMFSLMDF